MVLGQWAFPGIGGLGELRRGGHRTTHLGVSGGKRRHGGGRIAEAGGQILRGLFQKRGLSE